MKRKCNQSKLIQIGIIVIGIISIFSQCKKEDVISCSDEGTFQYDGRNYSYATIGTQIWMTENLAYLPSVSKSTKASETEPLYYVYGYEGEDPNTASLTVNYTTYGVLYNWSAALTACPQGWHLPTEAEWQTLVDYLGGIYKAGAKMREDGTNKNCFAVLLSGCRSNSYNFIQLGEYEYFWVVSDNGICFEIAISGTSDIVNILGSSKTVGFSIRCAKD